MWGCGYGGGGFGLGLLGGAMLASSMTAAYYSSPVVVRQPMTMEDDDDVIHQRQSHFTTPHNPQTANHQIPTHVHPNPHPLPPYIPPPPATYEERQQLFASGYGPNPDVVFYLFERVGTNSLCGIPGPWCPMGRPTQIFSPRSVPGELSDIYTVNEWITLRNSIEKINSTYQWHTCPLFCLYLCCVPSCLTAVKEYDLSFVMNHENHRLKMQGLHWDAQVDNELHEFAEKDWNFRLIACLRVDVPARTKYELNNPTRRHIAKQLYGHIVMPTPHPAISNNALDKPHGSVSGSVHIHNDVDHQPLETNIGFNSS